MTAGEGGGSSTAAGDWLRVLEGTGALTRGHFRLSSGLHSPAYVQCARLLEDPRRARRAGEALCAALGDRLGTAPDAVLAPAMGGLLIGHEVAAAWGVPFRFTERATDGGMALRRGFSLTTGEKLVVIEDVVTTGRSTRETIALAEGRGALVLGVGALLDRSGPEPPFDLPFVALARLELPTWPVAECPRCAAGEPIEKPGSRPDAG